MDLEIEEIYWNFETKKWLIEKVFLKGYYINSSSSFSIIQLDKQRFEIKWDWFKKTNDSEKPIEAVEH